MLYVSMFLRTLYISMFLCSCDRSMFLRSCGCSIFLCFYVPATALCSCGRSYVSDFSVRPFSELGASPPEGLSRTPLCLAGRSPSLAISFPFLAALAPTTRPGRNQAGTGEYPRCCRTPFPHLFIDRGWCPSIVKKSVLGVGGPRRRDLRGCRDTALCQEALDVARQTPTGSGGARSSFPGACRHCANSSREAF